MILVTGGAGFIGSNFILDWLKQDNEAVVNLDKLTYAGNLDNLESLKGDPRYFFVHGDIGDVALVSALLTQHRPRAVINFAAESHVDRSIHSPASFVETNVVGTFQLLEAVKPYWNTLPVATQQNFRFMQISTDEVYGSLAPDQPAFSENHPYQPNSPYSASKAAGDHMVRAWHHTYGLPVLTVNCSNNYGPLQFPEKLIPLMILNALAHESLPIYGDGQQIRDWLHVKDSCTAIRDILDKGQPGETYNVGGGNQKTNNEIVHLVCAILDELQPRTDDQSYSVQIRHVADRRGHDRRYAMDIGKMRSELGWQPAETLETGLRNTVQWYLDNEAWVSHVRKRDAYHNWMRQHYQGMTS